MMSSGKHGTRSVGTHRGKWSGANDKLTIVVKSLGNRRKRSAAVFGHGSWYGADLAVGSVARVLEVHAIEAVGECPKISIELGGRLYASRARVVFGSKVELGNAAELSKVITAIVKSRIVWSAVAGSSKLGDVLNRHGEESILVSLISTRPKPSEVCIEQAQARSDREDEKYDW